MCLVFLLVYSYHLIMDFLPLYIWQNLSFVLNTTFFAWRFDWLYKKFSLVFFLIFLTSIFYSSESPSLCILCKVTFFKSVFVSIYMSCFDSRIDLTSFKLHLYKVVNLSKSLFLDCYLSFWLPFFFFQILELSGQLEKSKSNLSTLEYLDFALKRLLCMAIPVSSECRNFFLRWNASCGGKLWLDCYILFTYVVPSISFVHIYCVSILFEWDSIQDV